MKRYIDSGIHTTLMLDFDGFCTMLPTDAGVYVSGCWEYWAEYGTVLNSVMFGADVEKGDLDDLQVWFDIAPTDDDTINVKAWSYVKENGLLLIRRNNKHGSNESRFAADVDLLVDMFMFYVEENALVYLREHVLNRIAAALPKYPESSDIFYNVMRDRDGL